MDYISIILLSLYTLYALCKIFDLSYGFTCENRLCIYYTIGYYRKIVITNIKFPDKWIKKK